MRTSLVSDRYAQALFDLAVERKVADAVWTDALELVAVCRENRMLVLVLKSPVIGEEKKEKILKDLFERRFHELTIRFLLILIRKGREMYIPEIARNVVTLYKEYKQILTVRLTTAVPATEDIRRRVHTIMRDYTNRHIELEEAKDPGIIGGFILNWGDRQYDASIRHQIERLHRGSARINLYVKGF